MEWRAGHPHIAYASRPAAIGWVDPRDQEGALAFLERFSREGVAKLKAENPNFPDLVPVTELLVQGVMVALIRHA